MALALQATTEVRIAPDAGEDIPLSIEPDLTGGAADLNVHLLLFPASGAEVRCDIGSVRTGTVKTVGVAPGVVEFSGSDRARLPKIPSGDIALRVIRASRSDGSPVAVTLGLDRSTGEIRASAPCVAAVSYSAYKARALELIYTPQVSGGLTTFGTIVAFKPPRSQTVYQVGSFDIDNGNIEVELYRIISHAVTTNEGEFEKPTNADGTYSGSSFRLDMSSSMETERVHEVGYMDQRGRAWVREIYVPIKEPFTGNASYTPQKSCRISVLPPEKFSKEQIARAQNFVKSRGYGCKGS